MKEEYNRNFIHTAEDNYRDEGARVGERIRRIREHLYTRQQFADMLNLTVDRVQQYENGFRTPKVSLAEDMAKILGVDAAAFYDPVLSDDVGVMRALFEMEEHFGLEMEKDGDKVVFSINKSKRPELFDYISKWYDYSEYIDDQAKNAKTEGQDTSAIGLIYTDYMRFKDAFPGSLNMLKSKDKRIEEIENAIANLQVQLKELKG